MPSSYADSFPPIVKLLVDADPHRVLDVGPGWGKYGLACREYLPHLETLDAIEVPQGRRATQDVIYDTVHVGDARKYTDATFWSNYDLALLIDVIEHMPLADGHRLLSRMQNGGCQVIVATPKLFFAQCDETNPYEEHVSLWTWSELAPHGIEVDLSTIDAIIFLLRAKR